MSLLTTLSQPIMSIPGHFPCHLITVLSYQLSHPFFPTASPISLGLIVNTARRTTMGVSSQVPMQSSQEISVQTYFRPRRNHSLGEQQSMSAYNRKWRLPCTHRIVNKISPTGLPQASIANVTAPNSSSMAILHSMFRVVSVPLNDKHAINTFIAPHLSAM